MLEPAEAVLCGWGTLCRWSSSCVFWLHTHLSTPPNHFLLCWTLQISVLICQLDPRKVLLVEDPEGDRKDGGGIGGRDTPLTVRALFLLALLPQGTLAPSQGFFQQSQKQPQSAISLRGPSASWAPPPPQRLSCKSPVSVLLVPEDPPAGGTSLEVQVPGAPLPSCEVLNFKTVFPFIP